MEIFYIDTNKFNHQKVYNFIKANHLEASYSNEQKMLQHYYGLYLVGFVAETYYGIKKPIISYQDQKPYFQNSNINFSISHSRNIVGAVFDKAKTGFDVEYNKMQRDFYGILQRFSSELETNYLKNFEKKQQDIKRELFYDFWTKHEAKIKLHSQLKNIFYFTDSLCEDFTYSIASEKQIILNKIIVLDE